MNTTNFYKGEVLDKKASDMLIADFEKMIANMGIAVHYEHYCDGEYINALDMFGFMDLAESKTDGNLEFERMGQFVVSSSFFLSNDVVPNDEDKIIWVYENEEIEFGIQKGGINYLGVNDMMSAVVEKAIVVVFNVYQKNKITRVGKI